MKFLNAFLFLVLVFCLVTPVSAEIADHGQVIASDTEQLLNTTNSSSSAYDTWLTASTLIPEYNITGSVRFEVTVYGTGTGHWSYADVYKNDENLGRIYSDYNHQTQTRTMDVEGVFNTTDVITLRIWQHSSGTYYCDEFRMSYDYDLSDYLEIGGAGYDWESIGYFENITTFPNNMLETSFTVDNFLSYWRFDDNGIDENTTSVNNITVLNNAYYQSGKYGNELYFNQSDSYAKIPNNGELFNISDKISFSFWLTLSSSGVDGVAGRVFERTNSYSALIDGNDIKFVLWTDSGACEISTNTDVLVYDGVTKNHISLVYDNGTYSRIYINGINNTTSISGSCGEMISNNTYYDFYIGNREIGGRALNGSVDDLRIYSDYLLTQPDVTEIYNAPRHLTGNYTVNIPYNYLYNISKIAVEGNSETGNISLYGNASFDGITWTGSKLIGTSDKNWFFSNLSESLSKRYLNLTVVINGSFTDSYSIIKIYYGREWNKVTPTITNLESTSNATGYVVWNWDNPPAFTYTHNEIYVDGEFVNNVSAPRNYYHSVQPLNTTVNISIKSASAFGINNTWVNASGSTRPIPYNDSWWNGYYRYRQPINTTYVDSFGLIDSEVLELSLDINKWVNDGKLDATGSCLRFVDNNNENELYFGNFTTLLSNQTYFKVKVDNLPSKYLYNDLIGYFYFVNSTCENKNNISLVVDIYDSFDGVNGSAPDASLWELALNGTTPGQAYLDGSGHLILKGAPGVISSASLISKTKFTNSTVIEFSQNITSELYWDTSLGAGSIEDVTGAQSNWFHTQLGNGYTFYQQRPYNYNSTVDMFLYSNTSILKTYNLNVSMVSLNNYSRFKYSYRSDGRLQLEGSDYSNRMLYPTHDGSGQATHPDIYYNKDWLYGYPYWLVYTPYPYSISDYEDPNIVVSYDGYYWFVPDGGTLLAFGSDGSFRADPDLVYINETVGLVVYYIQSSNYTRHNTTDGISWSEPTIVNISTPQNATDLSISPAIVVINETHLDMWTVRLLPSENGGDIYYQNSTDGGLNFDETITVNLINAPDNRLPWHIDAIKNGSGVDLLINYRNENYTNDGADIYVARWINNTAFLVDDNPIIVPEAGWSELGMYRATGFYDEYFGGIMRIWFSGISRKLPELTTPWRWNMGWTIFDVDGERIRYTKPYEFYNYTDTTKLTLEKSWALSQGEYSNGDGGERIIDYIMIYTSDNPISYTGIMVSEEEDIPPRSITNLSNTTGNFWHNWTWTNPINSDFNGTMIYINNIFVENATNTTTFYNLSASAHNTSTISIHTFDLAGNINMTWVNHTSVISNNPPTMIGIPDKNTNEDTSLLNTFDLDDYSNDVDNDTLTYQVQANNQSGSVTVHINAGNTVDFHLAADWYGIALITFTVSDGYGGDASDTMILTVSSVNDDPVLNTVGSQAVTELDTLIIDLGSTDVDGDTPEYSCNRTDLFTDFDNVSGMGTWTPGIGDAGIYYVIFTVEDGHGGSDFEVVTITVSPTSNISITSYWNNQTSNSTALTIYSGTSVEFGVTTSIIADNISWYIGSTWLENDTDTAQGNLTYIFNAEGVFLINVTAINSSVSSANTTFTVTVSLAAIPPPSFTSTTPATPYHSNNGTPVTFIGKVDQTGNFTWHLNGSLVQYNNSTSTAIYTNNSSVVGGPYNVTLAFVNANGTVQHIWVWSVVEPEDPIVTQINELRRTYNIIIALLFLMMSVFVVAVKKHSGLHDDIEIRKNKDKYK